MSEHKGRAFAMALEIEAAPDAVWKALADAGEVMRWFATNATITPGEGGKYCVSWDGAWAWNCTIDRWEPNRRLRLVDRQARPFDGEGRPLASVAPSELVLEFTLEGTGGQTLLRVVHSGFGSGGNWDDEIDGVSLGWNKELRGLRHYLERHRGHDRQMAWFSTTTETPMDDTWRRLTGPGGFVSGDDLMWLHGGDRAHLRVGDDLDMSGRVLHAARGRSIALIAEQFGDALFRLQVDRGGGKTMIFAGLAAWGPDRAAADRFKRELKGAFDRAVA